MTWNSTPSPVFEQSLGGAHSAIIQHIHPLDQQQLAVTDALFRINAVSVTAVRPKPQYDQSSRDGFALAAEPYAREDGRAFFQVVGEAAAGCGKQPALQSGQAVRIMTGAMVPPGCDRVVPFEVCSEVENRIAMASEELAGHQLFIRTRGSELQKGKIIIPALTRLQPDHLRVLAENGCPDVRVYRRPQAAVICTGSELVDPGEEVRHGQKISGNGVLLNALLAAHGGECCWSATVTDQVDLIKQQILQALAVGADMVITTGGMGPGKFDLMEQVFAELGGTVVYNRLRVRPGKFTLLGMIDRRPFFALPGPPPAVRILFQELIVPALNRLQGAAEIIEQLVPATLVHTLSVKQTGHLNLKGAAVHITEEGLRVQSAGRMDPINAVIHLQGDRQSAAYGEQVYVRLVGALQGLAV